MQSDELSGKAFDSVLIARLLRYVKPYAPLAVLATVFTLATGALSTLRPVLTKIAVDDHVAVGDFDGLARISLLILAVIVGESVLQYAETFLTQLLGQKAVLDLRMDIFKHLQKLSLKFFDRNPIGRLITRATNDVESLNEMLSSGLVALLGDVFRLLGILVIMFTLDWRLTLVMLSVLPFMFYGTFLFKRKVRVTYQEVRTQIARLNTFLQEHITGIATIQLFSREPKEFQNHNDINTAHRDANIKSVFYYSVFYPAIELLSSIALGLIIWYSGVRILDQTLTIGIIIAFNQYILMFFRPLQDLSDKYNIMQTAMTSAERIFKLLDEKAFLPEPEKPASTLGITGRIKFENVWFAYQGEDWVLKDVSFEIEAGKRLAIVGATGSGKTTIISLLSKFYEIQRGRITIDGTDIKDISEHDLRKLIGTVLQDVFLFSGTVKENITLGDESISDARIREAASLVGASPFIEKLPEGFGYRVQERGGTLSTGQRQLISFVRAMAYNPKILVLDEATSSVDTDTEELIEAATEKLMRGRTSIIIAHRLSTIQNADKIIVLHKGVLRESGTHQELLRERGLYYKLYQLQYKEQELHPSSAPSTTNGSPKPAPDAASRT
ncbi:MAG: ABC transporter ATP-binding protein [Rhizobacter sp.]|nr:ABC transporter ATP-binding protein [Chlorobiales bacterium]